MRINTDCHASDAATAYYEQQKRSAVQIVVDKLTGDPADPLTKILRDMAGMKSPEIHDKQIHAKEGCTNERRSTKADRRAP